MEKEDTLVEREEKPDPKESRKPHLFRRALNIVDLTEKRKRRDEWAGITVRGEWEDADALLLESARKPGEGVDKTEWAKEQIALAIEKPAQSGVLVNEQGELQRGRILGEGGLVNDGKPVPSVQIEIRTVHDVYCKDYSYDQVADLYGDQLFHFLPPSFPNTKRGSTQLLLIPWGMVGGDRPQGDVAGEAVERVWTVLCVACGYWRHVPSSTRHKFCSSRKDFRCKDSPWLVDCSSKRTELELRFQRVGKSIKDRRG